MFEKIISLSVGLLFFNTAVFSQATTAAADSAPQFSQDFLIGFLLVVLVFMVGIILLLVSWVVILVKQINKVGQTEKEDEEKIEGEDFLTKMFKQVGRSLTDAVPVEREKEIEFAHEYDGIRELDNSLPPWWKYLFYITIIFAVVYLYRYHISESAPLSGQEYKQEMAEAAIQKEAYLAKAANLVNESTVLTLTDNTSLENGKKTFTTYCVPCHGALGEGNVGPNFTDEYWLHGGGIKNVFKTIKYGVPQKGMISWQAQLRPKEIQEVASYILTLQGTNPPNPKAPQGDKYVPEEAPTPSL